MKLWQQEDPFAIIFHTGNWEERCVWGRLFRKELQFRKSEIQKKSKNELKWIENSRFGVWGHSYWSELRSECNGMTPGPQNVNKKVKKDQKGQKS